MGVLSRQGSTVEEHAFESQDAPQQGPPVSNQPLSGWRPSGKALAVASSLFQYPSMTCGPAVEQAARARRTTSGTHGIAECTAGRGQASSLSASSRPPCALEGKLAAADAPLAMMSPCCPSGSSSAGLCGAAMRMLVRGTGGPAGAARVQTQEWAVRARRLGPCRLCRCSARVALALTNGAADVAIEVPDSQHRGGLGQAIPHHHGHPDGLQECVQEPREPWSASGA